MKYRIGTRKSKLATTQSNHFKQHLEKQGIKSELIFIESEGDRDRKSPLHQVSLTPGVFTKELQTALLKGEIDLAVHSLKDVPTDCPPGLRILAISKREDMRDVLIFHPSCQKSDGPLGISSRTRIGTSSLRREAALKAIHSELEVVPLRGNVPTRIDAVRMGKIEAAVLAKAGLNRLQASLDGLGVRDLDPTQFVPAPGQGALAIESRTSVEKNLEEAVRSFHDEKTAKEVEIERTIMKELEGGCSLPLGVYCSGGPEKFKVYSFLGIRDSKNQWTSFDHYETTGSRDSVISKTVSHFKSPHGRR